MPTKKQTATPNKKSNVLPFKARAKAKDKGKAHEETHNVTPAAGTGNQGRTAASGQAPVKNSGQEGNRKVYPHQNNPRLTDPGVKKIGHNMKAQLPRYRRA